MAIRREYEMTEAQLDKILDAGKPVPWFKVGNTWPATPQENANRAWEQLGREMGFQWMTVKPIEGKDHRFFSAIPVETRASQDA